MSPAISLNWVVLAAFQHIQAHLARQCRFSGAAVAGNLQNDQAIGRTGWRHLRPEVMAKLRRSYDKQVLAEVLLLEEEWVAKITVKHAERLMAGVKGKHYPIAAA